jgi:tripartite-type tricarboxylate transporter receptor subunit TctC
MTKMAALMPARDRPYETPIVRRLFRPILFSAGAVALAGAPLPAMAAGEFFAGKTITLSTYTAPGDSYDLYLRLLSRHYGKHIPGNPNFIVLNQPGGGGLLAVNHAAVVAPQDGTFLTLVSQGLILLEGTGQSAGLQVSLGKFNWLGSFEQSNNVTATWYTSKIKTLADAMAYETTVGSTGAGGASATEPALYNAVLGTKFKIIYGYEGGAAIDLAMQRGEIDGRGANSIVGYKATGGNALQDGKLNLLIQTGLHKDPDYPDVPFFLDLVKGDPVREPIAKLISNAVGASWSFAAPPGVPKDRVETLRRAFDATLKDPEFLADAARIHAETNPLTGEQVQDEITEVMGTPKPIVQQIRTALGLPAN